MNKLKKNRILAIVGTITFFIVAAKIYYELKWYDLLLGILKIQTGKKPIALVSQKSLMFVTKKGNAEKNLIDVMDANGWKFVDRFGMGYVFTNNEEEMLLKRRDFSFGYVIFEVYPKENYRKSFIS